jgi:hypothetical protein
MYSDLITIDKPHALGHLADAALFEVAVELDVLYPISAAGLNSVAEPKEKLLCLTGVCPTAKQDF